MPDFEGRDGQARFILHPGGDDLRDHQHFVNAARLAAGLGPLYDADGREVPGARDETDGS